MSRLAVFSDVLCPWATVVVLRLHAARARAGADDELAIVHRALPLELLLERPVARLIVDAEIPLCASLTPEFGWSLWQGRSEEYPATSLLAAEAIQAASAQSLRAGEQLDVVSDAGWITAGTPVRVLRSEGYRHIVRAVPLPPAKGADKD